uniref:EthD domain-containing protein n=1 Tax=Panagrellus redivivus TaxID=6233 RepID=A0A7E4ZX32_PANRE
MVAQKMTFLATFAPAVKDGNLDRWDEWQGRHDGWIKGGGQEAPQSANPNPRLVCVRRPIDHFYLSVFATLTFLAEMAIPLRTGFERGWKCVFENCTTLTLTIDKN